MKRGGEGVADRRFENGGVCGYSRRRCMCSGERSVPERERERGEKWNGNGLTCEREHGKKTEQ